MSSVTEDILVMVKPRTPVSVETACCSFSTTATIWTQGERISNDPIGINGGLNQYEFCGNNPVNFVDPTGLCEEKKGKGLFDGLLPLDWDNLLSKNDPNNLMELTLLGRYLDRLLNGNPPEGTLLGMCPDPSFLKNLNLRKLKGGQGWRDELGNIWAKDKLHKDHYDVSDRKGNKIREIDFNGNQIWPDGPKNKNKRP